MAEVERLFSYGPDVRRVVHHQRRRERERQLPQGRQAGVLPHEDAVMKLLYLRVKELYSRWGEGCHQPGWARCATSCCATRASGRG